MADIGHQETDAIIEQLERRLTREYSQAERELTEKLDDYLRRFQIKDEKWQQMVANGEKTAQEYQQWRTGQIIVGERWEAMRDTIAQDLHNANVNARALITGEMPTVYALNHNFETYQIEKAGRVNTSYTLYNRDAVERLAKDDPDILRPPGVRKNAEFDAFDKYKAGEPVELKPAQKKAFDKLIAENKDIRWQKGQIQSVTMQSILQGESIPNMARRIARTMGETNRKQSIMYARTAMTSAQNAGRLNAQRRAEELGVNLKREWIATLDMRTRHEHRQLDGQIRGTDEPFEVDGYEIMYPGDPSADPEMIYNCRCTVGSKVDGWESKSGALRSEEDLDGMSYEEWKEGHSQSQDIESQEQTGDAMRQKTIREDYAMNDDATDVLANAYEQHRIANGLTSVPYEDMGKYAGDVVSADFGKLSMESAQAFTSTISDLSQSYDTPLTKIRTITPQEFLSKKDSFAFVHHNYETDTAELVINPGKCADKEKMVERIRELSERGYCVTVMPGLEDQYIATHEFAHTILTLGDKLQDSRNFVGADYDKIREARAEIRTVHQRYMKRMSELDEARRDATTKALTSMDQSVWTAAQAAESAYKSAKISDYSLTNEDDFLAEAFANERIGVSSNPYAAEVVRIIDKYFGR